MNPFSVDTQTLHSVIKFELFALTSGGNAETSANTFLYPALAWATWWNFHYLFYGDSDFTDAMHFKIIFWKTCILISKSIDQ